MIHRGTLSFAGCTVQRRMLHRRLPTRRRVVVTGLGLVTPLGVGWKHVWERLLKGECGVQSLSEPEYSDMPCRVAARVDRAALRLDAHLSRSAQREMSLAAQYACVAAEMALTDAQWTPSTEAEKHRSGVAVGMGMVGLEDIVDTGSALRSLGYRRVTPYFIPRILINMAAGHISLRHGLKGPNHAVSTACTTGVHALGDAARFIVHGDADVMLCGGTEASVCPLGIAGFARMRALSTQFNDRPQEASRPFDSQRDGFVMGEGAAIMVLEELTHAQYRGAHIYGEILGYGLSADANHVTAPSQDGRGAYRCMSNALRDAGLSPGHVGHVNAHATSTPLGDAAECRALHRLFTSRDVTTSAHGDVTTSHDVINDDISLNTASHSDTNRHSLKENENQNNSCFSSTELNEDKQSRIDISGTRLRDTTDNMNNSKHIQHSQDRSHHNMDNHHPQDRAQIKNSLSDIGDNAACISPLITSTKGAVGHLLGAAGAVEAVFTTLACHTGNVPPTLNCLEIDEEFRHLDIVQGGARVWDGHGEGRRVALTNSFGFGGTNASLCIASYHEEV